MGTQNGRVLTVLAVPAPMASLGEAQNMLIITTLTPGRSVAIVACVTALQVSATVTSPSMDMRASVQSVGMTATEWAYAYHSACLPRTQATCMTNPGMPTKSGDVSVTLDIAARIAA